MSSNNPVELLASGLVFWDVGLAAYRFVENSGGFVDRPVTTAPGDCALSLVPGNFAPVLGSVIHVAGTELPAPGAMTSWSAHVNEVAGVPTGVIRVQSLVEQAVGGSILAGLSFRIDVSRVVSTK